MKIKKILATALASFSALATFGFASCAPETLVVYTEAGFAPFEYMSNGQIVGVDVDIMNKVGEKLGKKVVFENVGFDTIVDAVAEGKLTNVGAAGISVTPERQAKVAFSNEYYTATLYVIYEASEASNFENVTTDNATLGVYWENLSGMTIAVQGGTTADLFLSDELAGGILDEETTDTKKETFSQLSMAVADVGLNCNALIIDELPAKSLIADNPDLKCAPLYYKGEGESADEPAIDTYAICVTKGQDELLNAINEVLTELGASGIQALVNKHLGLD